MTSSQPRRDPEDAERKILQQYSVHPGECVLDIGCGDGRLTWFYGRDAGMVLGLDVEMGKLRRALLTHPEAVSAKVYFAAARGEALPFASETFDLAAFSWSL